MPFDSTTARLAGQKSKRGKDKLTYELKQKLSLLADDIVSSLEVSSLSTSERIALLKIIAPYTLPKMQFDKTLNEEVREFKIEVIDFNTNGKKVL